MSSQTPYKGPGRPRLLPSSTTALPADEIMDVAAEMFANLGYDRTSFTAIAKAVGIQRASIYHYFANKDALLMQIGLRWLTPLDQLVNKFNSEGGPTDLLLYRYLRIDLRHIWSAPYNLGRLYQLHGAPEAADTDPAAIIIDTIHDAWTQWIARAVEAKTIRGEIDPALAGSLVESSYLGVISTERPAVTRDHGQTADAFANLILGGLVTDNQRLDQLRRLATEQDGSSPILSNILDQ